MPNTGLNIASVCFLIMSAQMYSRMLTFSGVPLAFSAMAAVAALMGGPVRVGLEGSLFIKRGKLAQSNARQAEKIKSTLEAQGNRIATPAEARAILGFKGADKVRV
ncbi:hypothetical protein P279_21845 [Rhodobacteraceae bacterium PD-2]|nr:hypothetical protein P279_21845 [Rhodobacteraceae bacterium PD-2]